MKNVHPLKSARFYKVKNPKRKFLCALCSAPREMKFSKYLSHKNYVQILLVSIAVSWAAFPVAGLKSIFSFFLVWIAFELMNKFLYRKEIPCPYCGFDATWYRRDVNIANQKVKSFWQDNYPELVQTKDIDPLIAEQAMAEQAEVEAARQA